MTIAEHKADPAIDGSLENWIHWQLPRHASFFAHHPVLLDVGAFRGSFSASLVDLKKPVFSQAILFEPNPENFSALQQQFGSDKRYRLKSAACGEAAGRKPFYCSRQNYTGSLLHYALETVQDSRPGFEVELIRLDDFLKQENLEAKVGMIKIDTQGNDLQVLRGAEQTLRASQPWIVTELIYLPLYTGQGTPAQCCQWLEERGYRLACQFNEYYTADGWLAWADGCFIPANTREDFSKDYKKRPTVAKYRMKKRFWFKFWPRRGMK